jgi:multiple antibiotic resistance protein
VLEFTVFLALEMILGIRLYKERRRNSFHCSIASPLIAGAGTTTSIPKSQYHTINIIIAIKLNMILVYLVQNHLQKIEKMLGSSGLGIIRKVLSYITCTRC